MPDQSRSVEHAVAWSLVPGATYFNHVFTDSSAERQVAIESASAHLRHCPVVFVDPDNGIEVKSVLFGRKASSKYVYWSELALLFQRGHSLLVYQHYPRSNRAAFQAQLTESFRTFVGATDVSVFATSHVGFVLALQPQHAAYRPAILSSVQSRWAGQISPISAWA